MPGLVDSTEGLCYAAGGLIFEQGLGGAPGLDNPTKSPPVFAGSGSLSVRATLHLAASARFAGTGSLKE